MVSQEALTAACAEKATRYAKKFKLRRTASGLVRNMLSSMATRAALGFKLHTGWAAAVAVTGGPGKFEVLLRRRIELLPTDGSVPRFVYHQAAEVSLHKAEELVQRAEAAAQQTAHAAVQDVLEHLRELGVAVKAAGIPCGSKPLPKQLADVLRSHPMIHTAEGSLFQTAVVSACEACGLTVRSLREREVWPKAADVLGLREPALRRQVDALRESVGAPWGADQKAATAFALLAMASGR
jgi:hypothetical protein